MNLVPSTQSSESPQSQQGRRSKVRRWLSHAAIVVIGSLVITDCSVNPATGRRELSLVSEAQEIAMGREADPSIVAQFGLYPDEELQAYVQELGERLAAESERPNLPWTFRVLDDPLVNAFALPGGFIYVTRGIMAHLGSEAELVGVLGHEIGHVTARHGASQMSKGMLAQIGFGVGAVMVPRATQAIGGLAQGLTQLLFLKYGRDDERQADGLGVRYAMRTNYDPRELVGVFETLGRVSAAAGAGGTPGWAATHPAPENRKYLIDQQISSLGVPVDGLTIRESEYMGLLDGVTFGDDVRQGFFINERFYQPEMAFVMDFPKGWQTLNTRQRVAAMSPDGNALVDLTLAQGDTPQDAGNAFYELQGIAAKDNWRQLTRDFRGVARTFGVNNEQGAEVIEGRSHFVQDGNLVFQLLGYGQARPEKAIDWRAVDRSLLSMRRLSDRKLLSVQPMRVSLVTLDRPLAVSDLDRLGADVSNERLMLINRLDPDTVIPAGRTLKIVKGFNPANGLPR